MKKIILKPKKGNSQDFYNMVERLLATNKGFSASFRDAYEDITFNMEKSPKRAKNEQKKEDSE